MSRPQPELQEGLREWEATPESREGKHPELREAFHLERAVDPVEWEPFRELLDEYAREHLDDLIAVACSRRSRPTRFNELLARLAPDAQAVEELGLSFSLWKVPLDGELRLLERSVLSSQNQLVMEDGVALEEQRIGSSTVCALDFMSRTVRRDTAEGKTRYFFRPLERYLGENDAVIGHAVDNLWRFYRRALSVFDHQIRNFELVANTVNRELAQPGQLPPSEEALRTEVRRRLDANPEVTDRLIVAHSGEALLYSLEACRTNLGRRTAEMYHTETDNPLADFITVDSLVHEADSDLTIAIVANERAPEGGVHSVVSAGFGKEIVYDPAGPGTPAELRRAVSECHLSYLAQRAGHADPEISFLFELFTSEEEAKHAPELLSLGKRLGRERTKDLLIKNPYAPRDREFYPFDLLRGHSVLRRTGLKIEELPLSDLTALLLEANEMEQSGIWHGITESDPTLQRVKSENAEDYDKLFDEQTRTAEAFADCYERGQRVLKRAKMVQRLLAQTTETSRTLAQLAPRYKLWRLVDYEIPELSDEEIIPRITKYPMTLGLLIDAYLVRIDPHQQSDYDSMRRIQNRMIGSFVRLMQDGYHPGDFLVAYEKTSYAQRVIDRQVSTDSKDEIDWVLERWPDERRENLGGRDLDLLVANEGLLERFGPHPAVLLSDWRSHEGHEWHELIDMPAETPEDLRFQLVITDSEPEDRELIRRAVVEAGWDACRRLYEQFSSEKISIGERYGWALKERDLPKKELRKVLDSLTGYYQLAALPDMLERYRQADDPLAEVYGLPESFRTLESRLSATPEEMRRIILRIIERAERGHRHWLTLLEAPNMDYGLLHEYLDKPEFVALGSGEREQEVPFKPMYNYILTRPLQEDVAEALGSRSRGVPGRAARPKKLFHDLKQFLRRRGVDLSVAELAAGPIPVELHEELIMVLKGHERNPGELIDYAVAKVHPNWDPAGWVSGNYTECCIPFGRSLNNDYMLNPAAQYFTISRCGTTIAQSVVIDAIDRQTGRRAIVLDSIEIAKNHTEMRAHIEHLYRTYWKRHYPNRTLLVGAMNGDPKLGGTKVDPKRFQPQQPFAYTDAWRFTMYEVPAAT